jgi:ribosomal protein L32
MATPKKRHSPVRSGNRRRNLGINLPGVAIDAVTGQLTVRHRVNPVTGRYNNRSVTDPK